MTLPDTGYASAHAASLCLPENRCRCGHAPGDHEFGAFTSGCLASDCGCTGYGGDRCRCGHSEYDHRESITPTGSGCTHWLCDGCAEYEKASEE